MPESYREIVLEGPAGSALGFVEGFLAGRGLGAGEVFDAEREGFDCAPLRERLREIIHPSRAAVHLLVPERLAAAVRGGVQEARAQGLDVRLGDERPLRGARFRFRCAAYTPEHAARVRALFEPPPEGLALDPATRFEERREEGADQLEAYAPLHAFVLSGEGAVEGGIAAAVSLYRRLRLEELVELEPLDLIA